MKYQLYLIIIILANILSLLSKQGSDEFLLTTFLPVFFIILATIHVIFYNDN